MESFRETYLQELQFMEINELQWDGRMYSLKSSQMGIQSIKWQCVSRVELGNTHLI